MSITAITKCRLCGNADLEPLLSLGEQFVNDFPLPGEARSGPKAPLELVLCPACTLVQLRHTVPPEVLYSKGYWYRSGVTQTMRDALKDVVDSASEIVPLSPGNVVLDIGSNDGTLLRCWPDNLVRVGVEPAANMVEHYVDSGIEMINELWSADDFEFYSDLKLGGRKAKVVTACGMFYDLDDPNPFVRDVARVLAPDGLFVAQLMCLRNMLDLGDVGNINHEHLEYYSLASLDRLFSSHGLAIRRVEENAVNGQSYRLYVTHAEEHQLPFTYEDDDRVNCLLLAENQDGLAEPEFYSGWLSKLERNRRRCVDLIRWQRERGKRVWIMGASTKGNVIAQWYGLDDFLIEAAGDRSPEKHGRCMVGTGIPIKPLEELREAVPDYVLVLPYAFIDEFIELEKNQEWRKRGGKFLVPLPETRVL